MTQITAIQKVNAKNAKTVFMMDTTVPQVVHQHVQRIVMIAVAIRKAETATHVQPVNTALNAIAHVHTVEKEQHVTKPTAIVNYVPKANTVIVVIKHVPRSVD
jgi:hypothetical protein